MATAKIVVGANLGDEGKGLTTDYLTRNNPNPIVVRFNGGGQAGHTVELPDGRKHVFHHFGSGSLNEVDSFLTKHFVVNPTMFVIEWEELSKLLKFEPRIRIDGRAYITTPLDMVVNWTVEEWRGNKRHGSCGFGINETVTRNIRGSTTFTDFITTVADLLHPDELRNKLITIRDYYLPFRLQQLGCPVPPNPDHISDKILDDYIEHCEFVVRKALLKNDAEALKGYETIIFEGAQGLLLDEYHKWFPHVTRSRTGVYNAVETMKEIGLNEAEVFYVTRGYLTRHGAGPLPFEVPYKIYDGIIDTTNINNRYQGELRFAPLNLDLLKESIGNDLKSVPDVALIPNLVITCLNQLPEQVRYVQSNILLENDLQTFLRAVRRVHKFDKILLSNSPTYQGFKNL